MSAPSLCSRSLRSTRWCVSNQSAPLQRCSALEQTLRDEASRAPAVWGAALREGMCPAACVDLGLSPCVLASVLGASHVGETAVIGCMHNGCNRDTRCNCRPYTGLTPFRSATSPKIRACGTMRCGLRGVLLFTCELYHVASPKLCAPANRFTRQGTCGGTASSTPVQTWPLVIRQNPARRKLSHVNSSARSNEVFLRRSSRSCMIASVLRGAANASHHTKAPSPAETLFLTGWRQSWRSAAP